MRPEFTSFSSIPRLSRACILTEKLDGTNATVYIEELEGYPSEDAIWQNEGLAIHAGSRNKWITPEDDNYGFASWVVRNAEELVKLGPGWHRGEWWGSGIQRKYGLTGGDKRWSMFNTEIYCLHDAEPQVCSSEFSPVVKYQTPLPKCVGLVPVLYKGPFTTEAVEECLKELQEEGSHAAPGFMDPEGIVVWHTAGEHYYKKTLGGDGHKSLEVKVPKEPKKQASKPKFQLPPDVYVRKEGDAIVIWKSMGPDELDTIIGEGATFNEAVEAAGLNKQTEQTECKE